MITALPSEDRWDIPEGIVGDDGRTISYGWDVEFGGFRTFCALRQATSTAIVRGPHVLIDDVETSLTVKATVNDDGVRRSQQLTTDSTVFLQDFVCRYLIDASVVRQVDIGGHTLRHRNSNVWHQFPVDRVALAMQDGRTLTVRSTSTSPPQWRLDHYARDHPSGYWVIHARLMPTDGLLWLRWDTRWGRLVDSKHQRFLRSLARTSPGRRLWYLAERRGGRPNCQLLRLGALRAGESLMLDSDVELSGHRA